MPPALPLLPTVNRRMVFLNSVTTLTLTALHLRAQDPLPSTCCRLFNRMTGGVSKWAIWEIWTEDEDDDDADTLVDEDDDDFRSRGLEAAQPAPVDGVTDQRKVYQDPNFLRVNCKHDKRFAHRDVPLSLRLVHNSNTKIIIGHTITVPLLIAAEIQPATRVNKFGITPHIVRTFETEEYRFTSMMTPTFIPWGPPNVPGVMPRDEDDNGIICQWGCRFVPFLDVDRNEREEYVYVPPQPITARRIDGPRMWTIHELPKVAVSALSTSSSLASIPEEAIVTPSTSAEEFEELLDQGVDGGYFVVLKRGGKGVE